jgi:predicted flap endonuclease-1-like 5' DNA nuclease
MFRDYKDIFKNLRDMQDQLWKDSMASFPGAAFPRDMNKWQQQTLEDVSKLMGQAVRQSLDLQREWLEQWSERASGKNLKPKLFAGLSSDALNSTQRWLDNQNRLRDQWLEFLRGSGKPGKLPDFKEWEAAVQESIQRQTDLLNDWSQFADFKKLSGKETLKLSEQINKAMKKSIETQQHLWSHWFNELGMPGGEPASEETAAEAKPKRKTTKASAKAKKTSAKSSQAADDLKQIVGIGVGLEKKLLDNGIATLKQIAGLSDKDIEHLEENIIRFSGRIQREKWVEQAKKLIS